MIFTTDRNTKNALNPPLIAQVFGVTGEGKRETELELRKVSHLRKLTVPTADTRFIGIPMYFKKSRVKSKSNLALIRTMSCFVCGGSPSDADHIKTKGAGGGDELSNLQALCRLCHIERHSMGIRSFMDRYEGRLTMAREKYDLPPMKVDFLGDA
jgi:hypothetical protein